MLNSQDSQSLISDQGAGDCRESPSLAQEQGPNISLPGSRKRKLAEIHNVCQIGKPFVVQAHPSFPSTNSQELTPILLLLRSNLPLAYLDFNQHTSNASDSKLFSGHVEALEKDTKEDQSILPKVLITQSASDGRLSAVERVQHGIYAICRLDSKVTLEVLEGLQAASDETRITRTGQQPVPAGESSNEWWRNAVIQPKDTAGYEVGKARSHLVKKGFPLCLQKPTQKAVEQNSSAERTLQMVETEGEKHMGAVEDIVSQPPEEVLDMIRLQYQEALYASQTPLAYFAKGPLSRARATFHAHGSSGHDPAVLLSFLKSSILTIATMDRKYRETLPNLLKDLPFSTLSGDEGSSLVASSGKTSRKSKKSKLGRNGLYVGEEADIVRWWLGKDKEPAASESVDSCEDVTKIIVHEQRIRETQLQMILILETLALEAAEREFPVHPSQILPEDEASDLHKKPKKPKKPQDLDTLLDLSVDRLSIWQSMSPFEAKKTDTSDTVSSEGMDKAPSISTRNDQLRHFCVDVILPFYGARLPKLTRVLCQKLGGSKNPSPKRPRLAKAATSTLSQQPRVSLQDEKARRPRRTLERVLTDERSASQRRPPSLLRSATEPMLPRMKREQSETSLSAIPLNKVAVQQRYSQREVDLHAASQATEAKLKQKVRVEQELQNAIAALKKPNPRMAVKELVEDSERRTTASRSRKSKNPVRNPFAQSVQVMATPSKPRHTNVLASPPQNAVAATALAEVDEVAPSSISRTSDQNGNTLTSSTLALKHSQRKYENNKKIVEQTPSKRPAKQSTERHLIAKNDLSNLPPEAGVVSGLKAPSKLSSTPRFESPLSKHSMAVQGGTVVTKEDAVQGQPVKAYQREVTAEKFSPTSAPAPMREQEDSIYASLGWDDELDDLI
ncbi:hypothetical protein ACLMJK_004049 [Lecanora helva]